MENLSIYLLLIFGKTGRGVVCVDEIEARHITTNDYFYVKRMSRREAGTGTA